MFVVMLRLLFSWLWTSFRGLVETRLDMNSRPFARMKGIQPVVGVGVLGRATPSADRWVLTDTVRLRKGWCDFRLPVGGPVKLLAFVGLLFGVLCLLVFVW